MVKDKFMVAPVSSWDDDEELFLTKVGTTEKDMPLLFICAGKTEKESRERAEMLVALLTLKENISDLIQPFG